MKKYLFNHFKELLIITALLLVWNNNLWAQWAQLGGSIGFAGNGAFPSLAINPSTNEPYLAYADGAANAFAVQKFDGTVWTKVGANLGFASNANSPTLAFNPLTNEAYVAYSDGSVNGFIIQKFNGTAWVQVGAKLGFASSGAVTSLKFNPATGEAFIAYRDGALNAFIVQKFNGTAWVQVGANQGFASNGSVPTLAFSPDNELYLSYPDGTLHAYIVKKFDGTSWVQVGANLGFASNYVAASIAFELTTKQAYIGYADGAANAFVVQKFNGTAWAQAGANLGFASSGGGVLSVITAPSLAFNSLDNKIYVAYPDGATHSFFVQAFNGTAWVVQGAGVAFTGGNTSVSLAFKKCSAAIYIGHSSSVGNAFFVQRFNPGCALSVKTQPKSQNVPVGSKAQFSVAGSYSCINYQWQTNTGAGYQNIAEGGQYTGTLKDTLTLSNITPNNNNQNFRCVIKADLCVDTSQVASLTINTSGIYEQASANFINVWPNPAHDNITIAAADEYNNKAYVIYDVYGKIVLNGIISGTTTVNVGNLAPAVYYIAIGNSGLQITKFLKLTQ